MGKPPEHVLIALRAMTQRPEWHTTKEWLEAEIQRLHNENTDITDETQWRRNQGAIKTTKSFIQRAEEAHKVLTLRN